MHRNDSLQNSSLTAKCPTWAESCASNTQVQGSVKSFKRVRHKWLPDFISCCLLKRSASKISQLWAQKVGSVSTLFTSSTWNHGDGGGGGGRQAALVNITTSTNKGGWHVELATINHHKLPYNIYKKTGWSFTEGWFTLINTVVEK